MIRVVVGGATGKFGRNVCDLITASNDLELSGTIVSEKGGNVGKELYPGIFAEGPGSLNSMLEDADVYVDLTSPNAASTVIEHIPQTGANMVIGTTAISKDAINRAELNVSKYGTSAVISANFSQGVNVFWKMCREMAGYLTDYDIEVIELHHATKKDAPSGTTLETLRILQEVTGIEKTLNGREGVVGTRGKEIGVHAIRAGDIAGDHTVLFAKNSERLELSHKAISRESLAQGCLQSIRWIADKKDGKMHNMNEVFGL